MKLKKDKYYQDLESKGYYDNLDKRTKDYKEYKAWKESRVNDADVTYEEVKSKIEAHNESKVGLGDVIEKVTESTGIKSVVKTVFGEDCGCDERKERFNNLASWRRKKVNCIEEGDYVWLKALISSNPSRFDFETRERLVNIYNYVFNTKQKNTKCYPCIKSLIVNLKSYLDVWEGKKG